MRRPRLTADQVLEWTLAHHARTGRWPTAASGPVLDAPGETWKAINEALTRGRRGLPDESWGGLSSLSPGLPLPGLGRQLGH